MSMAAFPEGTRVMTPNGPAKVRYALYAAPHYTVVTHYNVMPANEESGAGWRGYELPNYTGHMFPADQVAKIEG
jgi:hypothetical protein